MSTTAPEQPAGQDQQTQSTVAPVPATPGSGPWDADLTLAFDDPTTRQRVDAFMRSKVQPRMTQLEQQLAQNRPALNLWNDLTSEHANDTFVAIASEMYGEKAGEAVTAALQSALQAQDAADTPAEQRAADAQVAALPPEVQQAVQYIQERQAAEQYDQAMQQTLAQEGNADIDPANLHPFVAAANGNFQHAVQLYREFLERQFGGQGITREQVVPPVAPPVMGSDSGGAAPGTQIENRVPLSLDQAIRETVAEMNHRPAPPVM